MKVADALLWPLTIPYGAAAELRARAYRAGLLKQRRLPGVVISVGNLTVGGTGKTPMVLWIAERLLAEGKRVGVLTRGYRGEPGPREGRSGTPPNPVLESDEVRLLQSRLGDRVAFGVGADRFARGTELATQGVEWFILDDGFQHLHLSRGADIVLVDATNPFGGGHLLPAGRLREPRSALSRADIIVITRSDRAPATEAVIRRHSDAPIFYARPQLDSALARRGGTSAESSADVRGKKLFAFCAIGNPSAFLADLRDWGFEIAGHKFFPDHHRYTNADVEAIEREAGIAEGGAEGLICTEKDIFNLAGARQFSRELFCCRISFCIGRPEDLWRAIVAAIRSHDGKA